MRLPTHRAPTHPGEILEKDFLDPLGMSQSELAKRIHVPFQRVNQICRGRRAVTSDTALRLARFFGTSPDVWLNLQTAWDLWHALHGEGSQEIETIEPLKRAG